MVRVKTISNSYRNFFSLFSKFTARITDNSIFNIQLSYNVHSFICFSWNLSIVFGQNVQWIEIEDGNLHINILIIEKKLYAIWRTVNLCADRSKCADFNHYIFIVDVPIYLVTFIQKKTLPNLFKHHAHVCNSFQILFVIFPIHIKFYD